MHNTMQAIVLAAGMSSRFGTDIHKLTIPLCGKPLINYTIASLEAVKIPITVIVGHDREHVSKTIAAHATMPISFITQKEQKGTGHAVMCSRETWQADHILVMNGDMPLVSPDIIATLCNHHIKTEADVTFVMSRPPHPHHAYGRIIQNEDKTIKIVEARDFKGDVNTLHPINAGIYVFKRSFLEHSIDSLTQNNVSNELYLTDVIALASTQQKIVNTMTAPFDAIRGVNTISEFCMVELIKRSQLISYWMQHGVFFTLPETIYIDSTVTFKKGTRVGSHVQITGDTTIGQNCVIEPFTVIHNSVVEDHVTIHSHCNLADTVCKRNATVGPFARVREHTTIKANAHVGNFVEIKNSTLGAQTKVKHLSYLGDTTTGTNVNVGAGTITCNYDGTNKHPTTIQDHAFVGSNNTLVAPVEIGNNAYTAAGSTITEDVPAGALAFGRARQVVKEQYKPKKNPVVTGKHESNSS